MVAELPGGQAVADEAGKESDTLGTRQARTLHDLVQGEACGVLHGLNKVLLCFAIGEGCSPW